MRQVYDQNLIDCNNGKTNWTSNVKQLLSKYGFAFVFDSPHSVDMKSFPSIFKQRLIDNFTQEWYASINSNRVLDDYKLLKYTPAYETYLDILPFNLRLYFSRLRFSIHPLRIHTGRFKNQRLDRNERYCQCCNTQDIEDNYHFICICPCFDSIRRKYLKPHYYTRPSIFKHLELLQSENKTTLTKLSNYIKEALIHRSSILTHLSK